MATPMLAQYETIKKQYPDCIVLFRLGDFYEGFDQDAHTLSKVLGITLTGRGKEENRKPMAGIPYHALKHYLPKLIKAGYKVAIAEQMEEPSPGKIVRRDITKIITAGTILDENILNTAENNYLASIYRFKVKAHFLWGLSYADLSTGEFKTCEYLSAISNDLPRNLLIELFRLKPAEIIAPESLAPQMKNLFHSTVVNVNEDREYDLTDGERTLLEGLKVKSLKAFGIEKMPASIISAAALYKYLLITQKTEIAHFTKISIINNSDIMLLDEATIRNLELLFPLRNEDSKHTLFAVLNECATPMGQRKLRQWLLHPLIKLDKIQARLTYVNEFFQNQELLAAVREYLQQITDLERVLARIATRSGNARDLLFLQTSLQHALAVFQVIAGGNNANKKRDAIGHLQSLLPNQEILQTLQEKVITLIAGSIKEDPEITITEGNIIKEGYSKDLDAIKIAANEGKEYIRNLQLSEAKRTGISSLKVRYNSVFGYYIEISKSNLHKAPDNYIRKQTLVNAERFITEDLKHWEEKILGAEAKAAELEYQLFEEIRTNIAKYIAEMQTATEALAEIDVYANFAFLAKEKNYVMPELTDAENGSTSIVAGRHPVVELFLEQDFIPNDINFTQDNRQIIILTGPNMSGKSTYIRQVALLFLLAQIGSFIPATSAKINIADRIFTRVGASDNLAGGESTFMVEMTETANILNNATERSLIILDEIGRGTSTYDGVAIAWSVVEYIAKRIKACTLFATHYHELIELEESYPAIKNANVQVMEENGKVVFMHKIIDGGTDRSYGIHVAQIAGIPGVVITRAHQILEDLESDEVRKMGIKSRHSISTEQLMFGDVNSHAQNVAAEKFASAGDSKVTAQNKAVSEKLQNLDINSLTPLEALNKLKEVQDQLKQPQKD